MLTNDLLRVRRKGGRVLPRYLRGDDAELAETLAKDFVRILGSSIGRSRDEIEAALDAVPVPADARLVGDGLRKVLDGQCAWTVPAGVDPEEIRREVFLAAASAHRALDVRSEFDRDTVLAELAPRLGKTPAEIDAALYADLRENERLEAFRSIGPEALLERYDLLALPTAQVFPFAVDTHWPCEVAGRVMDSYHRWMEVSAAASMAGAPAVNVPVGFDPLGRPMGMQLIGRPRGDLAVLRAAAAYERTVPWPAGA